MKATPVPADRLVIVVTTRPSAPTAQRWRQELTGFAERLRARRRELGLTRAALARDAGIGLATVRNLELAAAEPSAWTLARLASALDTSMDWLYRGDEEA